MSKNIVVLTTSDFPYRGAPENFVRNMSYGLFNLGCRVEIVRFWGDRYGNDLSKEKIVCRNYFFKKPAVFELVKLLEFLFQIIYAPFFVLIRKYIHHDEAIVLYGIDRPTIVVPILAICKVVGMTCIRVVTEIYTKTSVVTKAWRMPNYYLNKWQIMYVDRYVDILVVLTNYLKRTLEDYRVDEERIIVIPNFIADELFEKKLIQTVSRPVIIGFCGNPSIDNGILFLAKSLSFLFKNKSINPEIRIIGNIHEKIKEKFMAELPNGMKVIFTGLLKWEDAINEVLTCDIMVNPRISGIHAASGFPTKVGEYLALGMPVVTTSVGDIPNYFVHLKEVVLTPPDDPECFGNSLELLINDYSLRLSLSIEGRKWALKNVSSVQNAKKLLDHINRIHSKVSPNIPL